MDTKKIEALLEGVENKADIMSIINAENGKDVSKYKERAETAESELVTHKSTISQLELNQGDSIKIKEELETLKTKIAEDEKLKFEENTKAEMLKRFESITTDKQFKHDFVKDGVFVEFQKALANKDNTGKSDTDIFTAITTDKDYFASSNPVVARTSMNNNPPTGRENEFKFNFTPVHKTKGE